MDLTLSRLTPAHRVLIIVILVVALPIDTSIHFAGQVILSVVIWLALFYMLSALEIGERLALWACLVIATAGELILSLLLGLYTYRLGNIPFFIPPGHVMLLMLAIGIAPKMPKLAAEVVLACAAVYAVAAAATGIDTLAVPLMLFLTLVAFAAPTHRPLYASTFLLALALELYGTWLGNWTWTREVPHFSLVTTNPPGLVSAFYAVLHALVACAALPLVQRFSARRLADAAVG